MIATGSRMKQPCYNGLRARDTKRSLARVTSHLSWCLVQVKFVSQRKLSDETENKVIGIVFFHYFYIILLQLDNIRAQLFDFRFNHRYKAVAHFISPKRFPRSWRRFNSIDFNFSNNYGKNLLKFFLREKYERNKITSFFLAAIQIDETSQTLRKLLISSCCAFRVHFLSNQMEHGRKKVRQ